jgi:acyl-homoserine lactone acylase PvdQ
VQDAILVKGRKEPFTYDTVLTPRGVVVASDREHGRHFALRWTGFEAGAAPDLAALALDVARSSPEIEAAIAKWKLPPRRVVFVEADDRVGTTTGDARSLATGADPFERSRKVDRSEKKTRDARSDDEVRAARSASNRTAFPHVLGVTEAARDRFTVGPLPRPTSDAPFRAMLDPRSWDASRAINAPGQSESRDSPHYDDLAGPWSAGEMVPLWFSDAAVAANAEATLTLVPAPRRDR